MTALASLKEKRSALGRQITQWLNWQAVHMPGVVTYRSTYLSDPSLPKPPSSKTRTADDSDEEETHISQADILQESAGFPLGIKAEAFDLLLPSNTACLERGFSTPSIREKERHLRLAQLENNLSELRRLLRIKASVFLDKKRHSVGQKGGTRSATLLADYEAKIERVANQYKSNREAAERIDPEGHWRQRLQKLLKGDIRSARENESDTEESTKPKGQNRRVLNESGREISWIWKVPRVGRESASASEDIAETEASEEEMSQGK